MVRWVVPVDVMEVQGGWVVLPAVGTAEGFLERSPLPASLALAFVIPLDDLLFVSFVPGFRVFGVLFLTKGRVFIGQ